MKQTYTIKKYYVYIVKCSDDTFYTGKTIDISKRLLQHNGDLPKGAKYTRTRRPVELVHFEEYLTNALAFKREREIKKLRRSDKNYLIYSKNIVVIGKGSTAGKPLLEYFDEIGTPITLVDSKTTDPKSHYLNADIIISSVGKQKIITPDMLKNGVILISIGISRGDDGKLHGDYETNEISDKAAFFTPTPGGVGPVNVAMLLENLVISAENI